MTLAVCCAVLLAVLLVWAFPDIVMVLAMRTYDLFAAQRSTRSRPKPVRP